MRISLGDFGILLRGLYRIRWAAGGARWIVVSIFLAAFGSAALEGIGIGLLIPVLDLLQTKDTTPAIQLELQSDENRSSSLRYQIPATGAAGTIQLPPQGKATVPVPFPAVAAVPSRPVRFLQSWFPGRPISFYVLMLCATVLSAMTVKNFLLYISSRLSALLRRKITIRLRQGLIEHFQAAELNELEKHTTGELANIVITEAGRTSYAIEFLTLFGQRCSIAVCYLLGLLLISWQLTLLTSLLAVLIGLSMRFAYRSLLQSGDRLTVLNNRLSLQINEILSGMRLIRTLNVQERESQRFETINTEHALVTEEATKTTSLITPLTEIFAVAGAMAIIGSAAVFLVQPGLLRGELLLGFSLILLRFQPLLNMIYGLYGQVINLAGAPENVARWLSLKRYPVVPFGNREFHTVAREIHFQNVTFAYPGGHKAVDNATFTLQPGRITALVGASGSGKSTLAALLLRLRQPSSGKILVDGLDYWQFHAKSWHRAIGFVEQEAFFFHDTVANNLTYGLDDVPEPALWEALQQANLTDVVRQLPQGLQTVLGERGASLSGGQRQRLAIARALVRNPRILILDEATSALDSISEQQVQEALNRAQQGRTVVVIAHRFSTIRRADKIVVLDRGHVVEQGPWDQLVAQDGAFARLLEASSTALV